MEVSETKDALKDLAVMTIDMKADGGMGILSGLFRLAKSQTAGAKHEKLFAAIENELLHETAEKVKEHEARLREFDERFRAFEVEWQNVYVEVGFGVGTEMTAADALLFRTLLELALRGEAAEPDRYWNWLHFKAEDVLSANKTDAKEMDESLSILDEYGYIKKHMSNMGLTDVHLRPSGIYRFLSETDDGFGRLVEAVGSDIVEALDQPHGQWSSDEAAKRLGASLTLVDCIVEEFNSMGEITAHTDTTGMGIPVTGAEVSFKRKYRRTN